MDRQQVKALAEQFIQALHRLEQGDQGALDSMVALFGDESLLTNAILRRTGQEHHGRQGAQEFWAEYRDMFRDVRSDFYQVVVNDQAAGLFWTTKGSSAAGQPIEYDGASLLVFGDDQKISVFRGYYDTRELSQKIVGG